MRMRFRFFVNTIQIKPCKAEFNNQFIAFVNINTRHNLIEKSKKFELHNKEDGMISNSQLSPFLCANY